MAGTTHPRSEHIESSGRWGPGRWAGLMLGAATLAVGLVAGFFFDWAVAIMPGLAETDDRTFVEVMLQLITTINTSAPFLLVFNGAVIFTLVAAILLYRAGAKAALRWTLVALVFSIVAVGITFGVHFPLHDTLGRTGAADSIADIAAVRDGFEVPWANAHLVRTAAVILALVALCRALWLGRGADASTVRPR